MPFKITIRTDCILCILCIGILLVASIEPVSAQSINAQVRLMLERLPLEKQQRMRDFAETLETYINDYDWTGESYDDEIPITIQIFLMDASVSYEERYAGTFMITNNLDMQYYDKYWRFPFQAGERMEHNENAFHPFTGFIDFYVYIIIGGEYDKYGKFMGTPFFEKAKLISTQAKFNTQFNLGWKERTELIDRIMGDEYKTFRSMKDLFYLGLSYVGEEDTTAQKYCSQSLDLLEKIITDYPDDEEAVQFLKAHHLEYIDIFKDDNEILEKLVRIDPDRESTYREHMK